MLLPDIDTLFRPQDDGSAPLSVRLRRRFGEILLALHPAASGCGPCSNYMLSLETRAFHGIQPDMDIDVIYTWVDGSDPAHAAKRAKYVAAQNNIHDNGLDKARFRDNQELRYSLRALEQYAPWVRNVILVTDNQCPDWIRRDHPKLRVVDHSDFIPKRFLPTFNSHVIEAYLHEIPGLAEHFIYLNDDVFLGRPCRRTDFFSANGLPLVYTDWRKRRRLGYSYTKTPHALSYFNTLKILKDRGVATDPKFISAHGPYAQTRTNAREAFSFYRDIIEGFASNRFRTTREIAMYCHAIPLWGYYRKCLIPCDERYYYVQTMRRDRVAYYKAILYSLKDHVAPIFFCINDVGREGNRGRWRDDLLTLLKTYYPEPCEFEKQVSQPEHHASALAV